MFQIRPRKSRAPLPVQPGPAELQSFLLELSPLAGLSWTLLQQRMSLLAGALRGEEGITERELLDLRRWCFRWQLFPKEVQAFYRAEAPADWVDRVLWILLDEGKEVTGSLRGVIEQHWLDRYGCPPHHHLGKLCPKR